MCVARLCCEQGKSAQDIRDTFHLPDDLTEEEKVQPINNATSDPRIRLLNRLYARKRQEIAARKLSVADANAIVSLAPSLPAYEIPSPF
eukprot:scaffold232692_cov30-Prasinocladus_malaysianus.AAC.3